MWWRRKETTAERNLADTQLEEIQQLKRQLDDNTNGNDAGERDISYVAAATLRSEIFRKLSILQVLRSSSSQSEFIPSSKPKSNWRSWMELLYKSRPSSVYITEEVQISDDLQQIINSRGRVRRVLKETFPFYWFLPPEMREQILIRVKSPADKLNVITALPQDSTFLRKDLNRLQCKVNTEKEALLKTSELSDEESKAIREENRNYLKEWLSQDFETKMLQTLKVENITFWPPYTKPKWRESDDPNPISVKILVDYSTDGDLMFTSLVQQLNLLKIMRHCGVSIWKCSVNIDGIFPYKVGKLKRKHYRKVFGYFCDCLRQMPELRYLQFRKECPLGYYALEVSQNTIALQLQAVEDIPLPELAHLRYLDLYYLYGPTHFIGQRIMKKYNPQLKLLIGPLVKHWKVNAPKLDALVDLRYTFCQRGLSFRTPQFNELASSPIKYVCLEFPTPWLSLPAKLTPESHRTTRIKTVNFGQLMCSLNCFGGTLEKLRLVFYHRVKPIGSGNQGWVGSLRFPKLKVFDIMGCPDEWSFLLQFPSLETLAMSNNSWDCLIDSYFPPGGIPKLSWNLEELCESSLWELLPHLGSVVLERWEAKWNEYEHLEWLKVGSYRISRNLMEKIRKLTAHKTQEFL